MDNLEGNFERDEIIADSEDEMEELGSSNAAGRGSTLSMTMPPPRQCPELSSIGTFSSIKSGQESSILGFTGGLPTFNTTLSDHSFRKEADTSGYSNIFDDTLTGTLSIADRAKTRKRKSTDILEMTSDEDDELSLKPTTSKPKAKGKSPQQSLHAEYPSRSTSDPQRTSDSSAKPRPRPRPVAKKPRMENAAYLEATKDLNIPSMPVGGPPSRPYLYFDLPPSSMNTALPRTETMGGMDDLFDGPLSSPGSLFSDSESTSKPKQRTQKPRSYPTDSYGEAVTGSPPPTFFAGSSQPLEAAGATLAESAKKASTSHNATPTSDPDVIDLTDIPATLAPAITVKKNTKRKKPPKKTSEEDFGAWEENGAAGLYVFDDDNDEDFNPSGDGIGKKKSKSKAKEKGKEQPSKITKGKGKGKQKNLGATSDDTPPQIPETLNPGQNSDLPLAHPQSGIPEVVITTKPARKSRKTKDKNRDASDALRTSSSNKEVFKSREFVDDSGDDAPAAVAHTTNGQGQGKPPEPCGLEIPEEVPIPVDFPVISKRPSGGKKNSNVVQSEEEAGDEDELVSRPSTIKGGKKKAIVDFDESAEEWEKQANGGIGQGDEAIRSSERKIKGKEGRKKGKAIKKSRVGIGCAANNSVEDHDEPAITKIRETLAKERASEDLAGEEEIEGQIVATKSSKKGSRKVVVDDGDILEEHEEVAEKLPGIELSSKENRPPMPVSNIVTPDNLPEPVASSSKSVPGALYARYEITPRTRGPSMSELIRRANSHPSSPFAHTTPSNANKALANGKLKSQTSLTPASRVYSPYLKSSRSLLNKIAPLHPNRRTPPPPPPPIPPKKKTKKELEREERWEEELVDSIGGLEAWAALGDDERKDMRRAKFAMEMGGWDD